MLQRVTLHNIQVTMVVSTEETLGFTVLCWVLYTQHLYFLNTPLRQILLFADDVTETQRGYVTCPEPPLSGKARLDSVSLSSFMYFFSLVPFPLIYFPLPSPASPTDKPL